MDRTASRVLVIGLDLGDGNLIHRWAGAGRLPALGALLKRGHWCWLETTADRLHISAWPTLYTGTQPGEHGVYFTFQPAPGVQGYRRFHTGLYGKPTFWQLLDQAGKRCSVLDPPYSHPEEGYSGNYVYEWGTWAHYLEPGAVPGRLFGRLNAACGRYPLGLEANDLGFAPLEAADVAKRLVRSVNAKADATCWLMQQSPWELLFTVFGETHVAGHYCWSEHVSADGGGAQGSSLFAVYAELDRAVRRICDVAGPDTRVMIVSGDGVGPNFAGWHLLPDVLARLGHLASADGESERAHETGARPKLDPVKALRDLLPKDLRKGLARKLPTRLRDKLAQRVDTAEIDWSRTRAFCLPTDLEGYIRVNLRGREPLGIVQPGAEYEALLDDLSAALIELEDPSTGDSLVREVIRTDRDFAGERRPYLPDLIVRWASLGPITAARSARIGTVAKASPDARPGTHRGPGFLLASGPGVGASGASTNADIIDVAPTVLSLLGVEPPRTMAGRVLAHVFPE